LGLTAEGTSAGNSVRSIHKGGTEGYKAPELVNSQSTYTEKVDIWALGCIIYELATGKKAFANDEMTREFTYQAKKDGHRDGTQSGSVFKRERFPFDGTSAEFLFNLIQKIFVLDRKERPNASEVLAQLRGYSFNDSMKSTKHAYSLDDKFWLTLVGDKYHHVRGLCQRKSGSETHEVSVSDCTIVDVHRSANCLPKRYIQLLSLIETS